MSDVIATGMLTMYPGVCSEDYPYPQAHFPDTSVHTAWADTLSFTDKGFLGPQGAGGRSGSLRFLLCSFQRYHVKPPHQVSGAKKEVVPDTK